MAPVLFVVLAAIWLVAFLFARRWVMRAMLERRLSVVKGSLALGLFWATVPLFYLLWQPESLPVVLVLSVLLFAVFSGVTLFLFRAMGKGPFV
jgi:hypothetical protein